MSSPSYTPTISPNIAPVPSTSIIVDFQNYYSNLTQAEKIVIIVLLCVIILAIILLTINHLHKSNR